MILPQMLCRSASTKTNLLALICTILCCFPCNGGVNAFSSFSSFSCIHRLCRTNPTSRTSCTISSFGPSTNVATNICKSKGPSRQYEYGWYGCPAHGRRLAQSNNNVQDPNGASSGFLDGFTINPPYAIMYALFIGFAFLRTMGEPEGASMEVLQGFFDDPLNPGCNELFATIFNLLGLFFVPMACLLMPGAKGQKLPVTPFLLGSALGGYGFLGPYVFTRQPVETVTKSELGWFTSNVLENKIFNWFIAATISSAYITSGFAAAILDHPNELITGYIDLCSQTAIASASSMDFLILTVTAASLIPEDLSRRGYRDGVNPYILAYSTVLFPVAGLALYCALRPSLEEE